MGRWTNWDAAEKLFLLEQRDKQQERQNMKAKSGRGGSRAGSKKSIMPFESMSKAEQKKYTQAGEMRTYRMLVTFDEFKEMDKPKRKEFLESYLKDHSKTELKSAWGGADIYYYLTQAGLHEPDRTTERMTHKKRTAVLLEQEREQIAAAKEKLEEDVLTAFTAAEDAKKELAGIKAEFNIMRQYFKQTLDEMKHDYETGMKTAHLMLEEQHGKMQGQEKEMQELKAYASSMDDAYCNLIEHSDRQSKENAALRELVEAQQAALAEHTKDVEFYANQLEKLTKENDNDFKRLELQIEQAKGLTSITAAAPTSNEYSHRIKGLEIDVTLLKQLAIK